MRVFVTGATGFVGSAVVRDLLEAGHHVLGLARSEDAADRLRAVGADVHRGALDDTASLRAGAAASDAVIHTAFVHDFSAFVENCERDRRAVEALGEALVGSARRLIVTSGTGILPAGRPSHEDDRPLPGSHPRVASEEAAATVAARGVDTVVVRLPPSVHGDGDHGFVPLLGHIARQAGRSAWVGDGTNRWPAVHRNDAARLYRLALEHDAPGGCWHAAAEEEGIPLRAVAEVIGRRLGLPAVGLSPQAAEAHFGWFAHFAALDAPTSSRHTRATLRWTPTGPTLLADIDRESYFAV